MSTNELSLSLRRGEDVVQSQYDRDARRYGNAFSTGDQIARDALKDIIIHIQRQIISNLRIQWQQETMFDFSPLQDASDSSQDQVVLVLLQLQQRILVSKTIENMNPPSVFPTPPRSIAHPQILGNPQTIGTPTIPQWSPNGSPQSTPGPYGFNNVAELSPSSMISAIRYPDASPNLTSTSKRSSSGMSAEEKPKATTRRSLFGSNRKKSIEPPAPERGQTGFPMISGHTLPATEENQFPWRTDGQLSPADSFSKSRDKSLNGTSNRHSTVNSINTLESSSIHNADNPGFNPWASSQILDDTTLRADTQSVLSSGQSYMSQDTRSTRRQVQPRTVTTISSNSKSTGQKDLLPSEANKFSGFCKGAWRLQIGDKKKAMDECSRPDGMYSVTRYWQCSKCKFEGRLIQAGKTKSYDKQVMLADGIQFRWEFLFKSHVHMKGTCSNPFESVFACCFCTAEGRGTPTFGGAQMFMDHLQEHRTDPPTGEVLYRMNCITDHEAEKDEDFDINLIPKETGPLSNTVV